MYWTGNKKFIPLLAKVSADFGWMSGKFLNAPLSALIFSGLSNFFSSFEYRLVYIGGGRFLFGVLLLDRDRDDDE